MDIIEPQQIGTDDLGRPIMYPDTPLLVTGSRDHTLYVWKFPVTNEDDILPEELIDLDEDRNPYFVRVLRGHTDSVRTICGYCVLDFKRNRCITGLVDNTVRIWDLNTGQMLPIMDHHRMLMLAGLITLSEHALVSVAADSTVRIWDPETGIPRFVLRGHSAAITCVQHTDMTW
ncbi:unnamed protein product [Ambrosiozyma monospora]|uniref:Unnamed protein product n=1 Tax=Ambrosiozyma monospora TaxID=43982 RepID=A0A9W6SZL0_AMBMO|nr:unnamed protein product [Ambrosiozyma monospora]